MEEINEETRRKYIGILDRKRDRYVDMVNNPEKHSNDKWDLVVITAIDEEQKRYYDLQISHKIQRKEIPSNSMYEVIADPPTGSKIGCGGSTLHVLSVLRDMYNDRFYSFKILLLHAGGYSKRLPNHSTSGKIFASVPYVVSGKVACTMLEMKMIILVDLPLRMNPGVFLACSDDLEFFESGGDDVLDFTLPGVTALAHPGPVEIGLSHGVYVISTENTNIQSPSPIPSTTSVPNTRARPRPCTRFLHKPSRQLMEQAGAILASGQVYLDSCYCFDMAVVTLLLEFYRLHQPLDCEVDAYGDFLQPLGSHSVPSYFDNPKNVGVFTPSLSEIRKKLYDTLKGVPLQVLPLEPSLFIHIGTCPEYIDHFCVNLKKFDFPAKVLSYIQTEGVDISTNSCIIHTLIEGGNVEIGEKSVVEFCKFEGLNLVVGKRCILSDVSFGHFCGGRLPVVVADGVFLQTLSIDRSKFLASCASHQLFYSSSDPLFLTVAFGTFDDIKGSPGKPSKILDIPILSVAARLSLEESDVWDKLASGSSVTDVDLVLIQKKKAGPNPSIDRNLAVSADGPGGQNAVCKGLTSTRLGLWDACLFPVVNTPEDSVAFALAFLTVIESLKATTNVIDSHSAELIGEWKKYPRLSLEKCLVFKDLFHQLNRRETHTSHLCKILQ